MDIVKPRSISFSLTLLGLLVIIIIYMSIPNDWEDAVTENQDGTYTLSKDWAGEVSKKKEQFASHDLYMLIALADGFFLCKHCPTGKFYLKKNEVYRYGTTGIGQFQRGYNKQWLSDNLLIYIQIASGDLTSMKMQEATLIGNYAILPENIRRPLQNSSKAKTYWYRLVLPPGNNSLD
jgi:hypothetical protein